MTKTEIKQSNQPKKSSSKLIVVIPIVTVFFLIIIAIEQVLFFSAITRMTNQLRCIKAFNDRSLILLKSSEKGVNLLVTNLQKETNRVLRNYLHAKSLLQEANYQIAFRKNYNLAILALQSAIKSLNEKSLGDSEYATANNRLARIVRILDRLAKRGENVDAILKKIAQISDKISLVESPSILPDKTKTNSNTERSRWHKIKMGLGNLVIIERQNANKIVGPKENLIRTLLEIYLFSARLALQQGNQTAFQVYLKRSISITENRSEKSLQSLTQLLRKILETPVDNELKGLKAIQSNINEIEKDIDSKIKSFSDHE